MSGLFDVLNHPFREGSTLNADFVSGIVLRNIMGLDTDVESRDKVNLELRELGPLDAEGETDFQDLITWVSGGTGVTGKQGHLAFLTRVLSLYEQAQPDESPWLDESEARAALATAGVVFTYVP